MFEHFESTSEMKNKVVRCYRYQIPNKVYWNMNLDRWMLPIERFGVHGLPGRSEHAKAAGLPTPCYRYVPSKGGVSSLTGNGMDLKVVSYLI